MPVSEDEIRQALIEAIIETRLGDETNAPNFAGLLVGPVTVRVNALPALSERRPRTAPVSTPAASVQAGPPEPPTFTVLEALNVRNRVAEAIGNVTSSSSAAEKLLLVGYIDVSVVRDAPEPTPNNETGEHTFTGLVPVQRVSDLSSRTGSGPLPLPPAS